MKSFRNISIPSEQYYPPPLMAISRFWRPDRLAPIDHPRSVVDLAKNKMAQQSRRGNVCEQQKNAPVLSRKAIRGFLGESRQPEFRFLLKGRFIQQLARFLFGLFVQNVDGLAPSQYQPLRTGPRLHGDPGEIYDTLTRQRHRTEGLYASATRRLITGSCAPFIGHQELKCGRRLPNAKDIQYPADGSPNDTVGI